jgi:thymidylate kinase
MTRRSVAESAIAEVREAITKRYGKEFIPANPRIHRTRSRLALQAKQIGKKDETTDTATDFKAILTKIRSKKPDAIFYLRVKIDDLVTRVLQSTGFDYWESGMDLHLGEDMYESFMRYQRWLLGEFDKMVETYGFAAVDASGSVEEVFADLQRRIERVIGHKD